MRITGPARRGITSLHITGLLTALATGAALLLGATPAASAEVQAEQGATPAEPRMKCVEQAPYYFHGPSGQPGGFSTDAPTNPAPAAQLASEQVPGAGSLAPREPASWAASFQGELCGQATVTLYQAASVSASTNPPLMTNLWDIVLIADDHTIATRRSEPIEGNPREVQEVTVTFGLEAVVAEELEFRVFRLFYGGSVVLYDSPDYAAGFTVSTLQPCEDNDPHPDCVEAQFAELAEAVTQFAAAGDVTADGKSQLLAALKEAETAYDAGVGDTAQAVTELEDFQRLAADPALVPTESVRDHLTTAASDLITTLKHDV